METCWHQASCSLDPSLLLIYALPLLLLALLLSLLLLLSPMLTLGAMDFGMPGADAGGYCHGKRLISSNVGGKCAVVVLAALVIADVDVGS